MDFSPKDFLQLKYNCQIVPQDKDLLEAFPELSRFTEFTTKLELIDQNKVIRYIILTYDKRTPLLAEKNLIKRKMLACKMAGFELLEGKFQPEVEEMIRGKNVNVNKMICRYCRNQSDLSYSLLVAELESFFDNIQKLAEPIEGGDMQELNKRATLYNHMAQMINSLESSATELFNGEKELLYEADMFNQEENGKIKSFPEFIASMREENKLKRTFKEVK